MNVELPYKQIRNHFILKEMIIKKNQFKWKFGHRFTVILHINDMYCMKMWSFKNNNNL